MNSDSMRLIFVTDLSEQITFAAFVPDYLFWRKKI